MSAPEAYSGRRDPINAQSTIVRSGISGKSHLQIIADQRVQIEAADEEIEKLLLVREQAAEFVRYFAERGDKAACDLLKLWGMK